MILPCSRAERLCLHCVCASAELTDISCRESKVQLALAAGTGSGTQRTLVWSERFGGCSSIAPCTSPAVLVWGLSGAGVVVGCGIESEERAEPCDKETPERPLDWLGHSHCRGRTANYISSVVLWVPVVLASSLGSAGTWSQGELCPGCGMACSSHLQKPWELECKVDTTSSAHALC